MTTERRREVKAFTRHGLPGMTLLAHLPELVKRCKCGRIISGTRARCMACQQEALRDLAGQIETQELLDAVLDRSFPEMRNEMLRDLMPYLKFKPLKTRRVTREQLADIRPGLYRTTEKRTFSGEVFDIVNYTRAMVVDQKQILLARVYTDGILPHGMEEVWIRPDGKAVVLAWVAESECE